MNNENNDQVIYCSRCGSEMKESARYCMKCGNLNYNHEANASMKKYMNKEENKYVTYHVGSAEYIDANTAKQPALAFANNTGSQMICFLVNACLYFLLLLVSYSLFSKGKPFMDTIRSAQFTIILMTASLSFFYMYSLEHVFIKANKRWWTPLLIIYNVIEYSDLVFKKRIYAILFFIPFTLPFVYIVSLVYLAKKFDKSPIATVLFPFIVIPIIGFGGSSYNREKFVFGNQKEIERNYLFRTILEFILILNFGIGLAFFLIDNKKTIKYIARWVDNIYYVYVTNVITHKVKSKVSHDFYSCGEKLTGDETIYFYYPDVGKKSLILFYHSRDAIEGYVKYDGLNKKYYVTISDGTYGFPETEYGDITPSTVVKYKSVPFDKDTVISCES